MIWLSSLRGMVEVNRCHTPTGPKGGQFCASGGGLDVAEAHAKRFLFVDGKFVLGPAYSRAELPHTPQHAEILTIAGQFSPVVFDRSVRGFVEGPSSGYPSGRVFVQSLAWRATHPGSVPDEIAALEFDRTVEAVLALPAQGVPLTAIVNAPAIGEGGFATTLRDVLRQYRKKTA